MSCTQSGGVLPSLLLSLWLAAAGAGFVYLTSYNLTPSKSGLVPESWPEESTLILHSAHPTLVMLLHPHCACSKASLAELERVLVKVGKRLQTYVLFVTRSETADKVQFTNLWRHAQKLPGVETVLDYQGEQARLFGSYTSGQVALYDTSERRIFQGGITASRGHEGDNLGSSTIIELARETSQEGNTTPVFGCGLLDENRPAQAQDLTLILSGTEQGEV